jgi:cytochrome c-type biogenesis protein CcmH
MNTTTDTIEDLKQKLAQLKDLHDSGVLADAPYSEGRAALERRILDLVLTAAPQPTTAMATSSAPSKGKAQSTLSGKAAAAAYAATAAASASPVPAKPVRPSALLVISLAVGVLALALAGYAWKGSPAAITGSVDGAPAAADGKAAPHATGVDQIAAMTEKLAERLKDKPDDVEGWSMLARSYSVLGRHAEALKAYEKATSLRKDDPTLLADYADSMAVNNNSDLTGEPMKLVERALKLDPKNLKALYLAGTQAFNTKDYTSAVQIWEKMVAVSPPGNVFVQQVEPAIVEARKLAGMPPAAKPLDAALAPAAAAAPAAAGGGVVSGTVTLSSALAKQAQPDDTVFVFARAAEGSRMPLAILRKQVKDLPLTFSLNDSMAMSPASALSTATKVIVGARVSKSGNAMPQPGDLAGQSSVVNVGATGLQIEIKETVKP